MAQDQTPDLVALVERARQGEAEALTELVLRFQDMAYGYAYSLLGSFQAAEDAAQESFIEALRHLDQLREPAAFPGWFRRIVFKQCDRQTRGKSAMTVPLEDVEALPDSACDLTELVARREVADRVLAAVDALPEPERVVTTLFYINGYSQAEIAQFLDTPVMAVKNRLRASKRRLREGVMGMVADSLRSQPLPEDFARATVETLRRTSATYDRAWLADPLRSDPRGLHIGLAALDEEEAFAATPTLPPDAVHAAFDLYAHLGERQDIMEAILDLLGRYRAQPLPPDEEAWARWNVVNALAGLGRMDEAVAAQRALLGWARRALPPDEWHWALHAPLHAAAWRLTGRLEEWLGLLEGVRDDVPATDENRWWRLQCLVTAGQMLAREGREGEALAYADCVEALSCEDSRWPAAFWASIEARIVRMAAVLQAGDSQRLISLAEEATAAIEAYEGEHCTAGTGESRWRLTGGAGAFAGPWDTLAGQDAAEPTVAVAMSYHWVATLLYVAHEYARAVPLFERSIARRNPSPHAYLCHAASVWALTGDRARVVGLLRRAARLLYRMDNPLARCPEFRGVAGDADFVQAIASATQEDGAAHGCGGAELT